MSGARVRHHFCSVLCRFGPLFAYFALYFLVDFASVPNATPVVRRTSRKGGFYGGAMPGPSAVPVGDVNTATGGASSFSFPPEPMGMREVNSPSLNAWWDEEALYLDRRDKVPESSRFFKNVNMRPDNSIFDPDVVMQFLALFGHFVRIQRPVRQNSLWHTGEFKDRRHTIPFITGDSFRMMADFYCDNEIDCEKLPKIIGNASHQKLSYP